MGVGISQGLVANPRPSELASLYLLALLGFCIVVGEASRRYLLPTGSADFRPSTLLAFALLIIAAWFGVVVISEVVIIRTWPSPAAMFSGVSVGLALFGLWLQGRPSLRGANIAVTALYLACATIGVATLVTAIPSPTFWVITAVIPAWQARRLAVKGDLHESFRLIRASIRIMIWVLLVALMLPALLQYRA